MLSDLELVSSRMAVAHLLDSAKQPTLYGPRPLTGDDLAEGLRASLLRSQVLSVTLEPSLSNDSAMRCREIADDLTASGRCTWPTLATLVREARGLLCACRGEAMPGGGTWRGVVDRLRKLLGSDLPVAVRYEFQRSMDYRFFLPEKYSLQLDAFSSDPHVHVGGSVSWDDLWEQIMLKRFSANLFSRPRWRLLEAGDVIKLLALARAVRRELLQRCGLLERADQERDLLRGLRQDCTRYLPETRDYVLIRSVMRREMVCGWVESLDEFAGGAAWRRFWGQKPSGIKAAGGYGHLRRLGLQDKWKIRAACENLERLGVKDASLRMNLDPRATLAWQELRSASSTLLKHNSDRSSDLGLVIHGRRPNDPRKENDYLKKWEHTLHFLRRTWEDARIDVPSLGLDMAGPERNMSLKFFSRSLLLAIQTARKLQPGVGVSVHAGEDFFDPWHGLLRVYRAIALGRRYKLSRLRIGHGSILGIDPYVLSRWRQFDCPAWVRRESLRFAELITAGEPHHVGDFDPAQELALLRGCNDALRVHLEPSAAERLSFYRAQARVATMARESDVVFETNPTSNVLILRAPDYRAAPIFGLVDRGLRVALGTDNPGIFDLGRGEELERVRRSFSGTLGAWQVWAASLKENTEANGKVAGNVEGRVGVKP